MARKLGFVRQDELLRHKRALAAQYFEAARTHRLNEKHWAAASGFDLNAQLLPDLDTIRNRALFEIANSGYAAGLVNTYADDLVGKYGPRLQIVIEARGRAASSFERQVEADFASWCEVCDASSEDQLCDLLRMQVKHWFWAGEFAQQLISDADTPGPVQLRLLPIAPQRIATPLVLLGDQRVEGGVRVDRNNRPVEYYVLKEHPGSLFATLRNLGEHDTIPARDLRLVFEREQAGQVRGVPKLSPVIETFAQVRQYISDTQAAARVAAMMAGFVYTDHPEAKFDDLTDELEIFDMEPGTLTTLPQGWKFEQSKPTQPTTTFKDFKREQLSEAARPIAMPWLRIGCDASGHTYSSARLDMNGYWGGIRTKHGFLERRHLTPLFRRWLAEYRLATGISVPRNWRVEWSWEPGPAIDEVKTAGAQKIRLQTVATLRDECDAVGKDWAAQIRQWVREEALERAERAAAGLPEKEQAPSAAEARTVRSKP